jgi:GxxExxY protein
MLTSNPSEEYPFKKQCFDIIGCCMDVHNELGCGFLEAVYQEALEIVLIEKNIPHQREKVLDVNFRGRPLIKKYVTDFLCFDEVIVELKAADVMTDQDLAQVLNYLKASGKKIGLLVNFGTTRLQYKRVIH